MSLRGDDAGSVAGDPTLVGTEKFSLLFPVYKGDDVSQAERALLSCLDDQSRQPDEVVVVRDGPVSGEMARMLHRRLAECAIPSQIIELEVNRGLAHALNAGLEACTYDIVARMDADDIAVPSRFERQVGALEARELDLIGSGMYEFADHEGSVLGRRTPPVGAANIARYARFHDPFNHPTVVYRKAAVLEAGGYEQVGLMEDYWLFARMIHSGARVDNLPDPLVLYRVSAGAYARRGGLAQLRGELALQHLLRRSGFTSLPQLLRNVVVRGCYRLVPESLRRVAYRRIIAKGFRS